MPVVVITTMSLRLNSPARAGFFICSILGHHVNAYNILNTTTTGTDLQTWWHDNGEINYDSVVEDENVRQSHIYSTWVSSNMSTNDTL